MSRTRILVVDDEPWILRAMVRMLVKDHDVEALADPMLALVRLDAGADYDVIFCDVTMPMLSGLDLYRRSIVARPELARRFVFVSGNGSDAVHEFLAQPEIRSLQKPFDTEMVRTTIARVLAERGM